MTTTKMCMETKVIQMKRKLILIINLSKGVIMYNVCFITEIRSRDKGRFSAIHTPS